MDTLLQDSVFIRLGRWILAGWVFVFVLALFPLTEDAADPIKMLITHGALLVVALLCLLDATMFAPAMPRASGLVFAAPAALITLALFSIPLLDILHQGMLDATRWWLIFFAMAGIFARVYTKTEQAIRFFQVFLCAVALSSIYGLMQRLGLDPLPWGVTDTFEYLNLPATYGNPNFAGHVMVVAILLSLGLAMHKREPLYLLFTALSAFHLYLTHMRAGWVALAGALVMLIVFSAVRRVMAKPFKVAVVSVGLLLAAVALGIGAVLYVLAERSDQIPPLDSSLQLRLNGYVNAANMILEHPLTGVGPGRYIEETPAHWTPFEKKWFALEERRNAHVHNEPLELGVELGLGGIFVYGLLFFGGLLGALLAAGRARFGEDRMLGLLLATLIAALAVDGLFGFNLHVPVSAALTFAAFGLVAGLLARGDVLNTDKRGRMSHTLAAALLLFSVGVSAWFEVQSFQAEMQYQRAQGARLYASTMQGNPEQFNYGLNEAAQSLRMALGWKPWEPRFAKLGAIVETSRANFTGAHEAWKYVLDLSPNDPHALHGVLDSALNAFLQSGKAEPGSFFQSTKAQEYFSRLEKLAPDWPDYLLLAGRIANDVEKNPGKAKSFYESALKHGSENKAYLNRLIAQIEANTGNAGALAQLYRNVIEADPTVTEAWDALKSSSLPTDAPQEWVEMLHAAWMKTRGNPAALDAHVYLAGETALAYSQMNDGYNTLALNIITDTLGRAPGNPTLLQTRDKLGEKQQSEINEIATPPLSSESTESSAVMSLKELLKTMTGEERAIHLVQLSETQAQSGATAEAVASAREAFSLMPEHNGVKLNLARRLVQDGKEPEAIFYYMTLLRKMSADDADRAQVMNELDTLKARMKSEKETANE